MTEQGKRSPFETQRSLIEGVRQARGTTGEFYSEEAGSWRAACVGLWWPDITFQFADDEELSGIEAAVKVGQAFKEGLEPFVADDWTISFNNPKEEE